MDDLGWNSMSSHYFIETLSHCSVSPVLNSRGIPRGVSENPFGFYTPIETLRN